MGHRKNGCGHHAKQEDRMGHREDGCGHHAKQEDRMGHREDGCGHHAKQEDRETFNCLKEIKKLVEAKVDLPTLMEMQMKLLRRNSNVQRPEENIDSSTLSEVFSFVKDGRLKKLKVLISKDGDGIASLITKDGQTILHFAAGWGHTRLCTFLICDLQFDVNVDDFMGRTPLHEAALGNHVEILRFLIEHGACLKEQTSMGETALHCAAEAGSCHAISYLISQGLDVNATSHFGTPLWIAAIENQGEAMQTLLRLKANPNIFPEGMLSPLHASILTHSNKCVDELLWAGADPNIKSCNVSPLDVAYILHDERIKSLLLERGAISNVVDEHEELISLFKSVGEKAFDAAKYPTSFVLYTKLRGIAEDVYSLCKSVAQKAYDAKKYQTSYFWYTKEVALRLEEIEFYKTSEFKLPSFEEIRMLIRAKMAAIRSSNFNPKNIDTSTTEKIFNAVECGDIAELRQLIRKLGAARVNLLPNIKKGFGETLLHFAAGMGHTRICKYLISKLKFNINIKDSRGRTPIHTAAIQNAIETLSYLIKRGADLSAETFEGRTVLHFAAGAGSLDVMNFLIESGFDVNVRTDFGTPLCSAGIHNQKEAMLILLSYGADPNGFPEYTHSPLYDSIVSSCYESVELLLSANADPNIKTLGISPIEIAIKYGGIRILELLLEKGANPNEKNYYDLVPLELAVLEDDEEMVKKLFPLTPRIPYIEDWSMDGVTKYYQSEEGKKQMRQKARRAYSIFNSKGQEAYMEGRYEAANVLLSEAIEANKEDKACLLKRCLCRLQINDTWCARVDGLALDYESGWAEGKCVFGLIYVLNENLNGAEFVEEGCQMLETQMALAHGIYAPTMDLVFASSSHIQDKTSHDLSNMH